jgi:hypothetical protein
MLFMKLSHHDCIQPVLHQTFHSMEASSHSLQLTIHLDEGIVVAGSPNKSRNIIKLEM